MLKPMRLRFRLPSESTLRQHPSLRWLGRHLAATELWRFNRRTIAGAAGFGLFLAWVPFPMQMLMAATTAVVLRVNLPVCVAMVWFTNPITIPPLFYFAYKLGVSLLGDQLANIPEHIQGMARFGYMLEHLWQPVLLGSLVMGVASGVIGYCTVHLFWLIRHHRKLRKRLQCRNKTPR